MLNQVQVRQNFPTYPKRFERDKTDFSKVKKITAWIYSMQENASVEVGLVASIASVASAERVQQKSYELAPGWNQLVYDVDLNILNIAYDITLIQGISFAFQNVGSRDLEDAPVFYLDDVIIVEATEKVTLEDIVELKPYEICDFERLYQDYVVSPAVDNPLCMPDIERTGEENGIKPTSGGKMLKLVTHPGEKEQASWPRITIPEKIMQKAFGALTEEEKSVGKVQFDIYNASSYPKIFYPEFYSAGGKDWQAYNVVAEPGKWVTFSVPFSKLNSRIVEMPGYLKVAWGEYVGENQTFYLDNFRISAE